MSADDMTERKNEQLPNVETREIHTQYPLWVVSLQLIPAPTDSIKMTKEDRWDSVGYELREKIQDQSRDDTYYELRIEDQLSHGLYRIRIEIIIEAEGAKAAYRRATNLVAQSLEAMEEESWSRPDGANFDDWDIYPDGAVRAVEKPYVVTKIHLGERPL